MLKIVICDDEAFFLEQLTEKISSYLKEKEIPFQISTFHSGEQLQQDSRDELFDIAFLDISMEAVNGIDAAHYLRTVNQRICIIFVTGYMDYVLEGYKVGAFRYLLKDTLDTSFLECMEGVLQKFYINTEFCLELNGRNTYLKAEDICLVESRGHRLFFLSAHDQSIIASKTMKLADIEQILKGYGFLRVHQSFLVNMKYITKISGYRLELEQKITLNVPKNRYQYVKQEYAFYRGDSL